MLWCALLDYKYINSIACMLQCLTKSCPLHHVRSEQFLSTTVSPKEPKSVISALRIIASMRTPRNAYGISNLVPLLNLKRTCTFYCLPRPTCWIQLGVSKQLPSMIVLDKKTANACFATGDIF